MTKSLNLKFEKGVRLMVEHYPPSDETSRKPVLFHGIRVGVYLYERNYSEDVVVAGLLHDTLEFSSMSAEILRDEFGENVLKLVKACTKDDAIADPHKKTEELICRCVAVGLDALIVKTADILDSFRYYSAVNNSDQLKYCKRNAEAILKYKPANFDDKIFEELKGWQKSCVSAFV